MAAGMRLSGTYGYGKFRVKSSCVYSRNFEFISSEIGELWKRTQMTIPMPNVRLLIMIEVVVGRMEFLSHPSQ